MRGEEKRENKGRECARTSRAPLVYIYIYTYSFFLFFFFLPLSFFASSFSPRVNPSLFEALRDDGDLETRRSVEKLSEGEMKESESEWEGKKQRRRGGFFFFPSKTPVRFNIHISSNNHISINILLIYLIILANI